MVQSKKPSVSEFHTVAVSLNAMQQSFSYHVSVGDNGVCPLRRDLSAYGNKKKFNDTIGIRVVPRVYIKNSSLCGRVLFLLPEYRRKSNLIREYRKDQ